MGSLNDKKTDACQVCGDTNKAGWHCGAITCEACKKFFMRNVMQSGAEYQCVRKVDSNGRKVSANCGSCVITKLTRTTCPYCRFKKCQQIGMTMNDNKAKVKSEPIDFSKHLCQVCDDPSTGVHFGVLTCEGCKGFFRRSVNESANLTCNGTGNCEIRQEARNTCRKCRLDKCISVGMDLNKCKIGRQSNLFKQKLRKEHSNSMMCDGSSSTVQYSPLNGSINDGSMYQLTSPPISTLTSLSQSLDSFNVGSTYEGEEGVLIKSIFQSYKNIENTHLASYIEKQLSANFFKLNPMQLFPLELIKIHTDCCVEFLTNLPISQSFSEKEKYEIIKSSIHLVRFVQLIDKSNHFNYFNYDPKSFENITKHFPIFEKINDRLKLICERIRELTLDSNELAIFTAYLVFTSSYKITDKVNGKFQNKLSLDLCRALSNYMYARRFETESCEVLVDLSFKLEMINMALQQGIYENLEMLKCEQLDFNPQTYKRFLCTQFVSNQ